MGSKAHFWRTMTSRVWNKSLVCDTGNVKPKSYIWILNTFNRNNVHSYRTFFVTESSDRLWCSKIYAYDITLSPFQNQEFLEPSQLYICSTGYAFVNNVYTISFSLYPFLILDLTPMRFSKESTRLSGRDCRFYNGKMKWWLHFL